MVDITSKQSINSINRALAKGGDFCFKAGTYLIKNPIRLCSNTRVICEKGTVFLKGSNNPIILTSGNEKTTQFKGANGVTWEGGTFKSNQNSGNVIVLFHAKEIVLKGLIMDGTNTHFIEINACNNVTITSCIFRNQTPPTTKEHKEAIQIDFAYYDGLPMYGKDSATYDGTHCRNITIHSCSLERCMNGIGTHTISNLDKYHSGIVIRNNTIKNTTSALKGDGIRLVNMRNVEISGNVLMWFEKGVRLVKMKKGHVANGGTVTLDGYKYCQNITLENNDSNACLGDVAVE